MAKPNDKIDDEVIKAVTSKMERALRRGITMQYVEELRDRIVKRTRVGIGVNPETGKGERLKKLSTKYIQQRKGSKTIKRRAAIDKKRRKAAREESKRTGEKVKPNLVAQTSPAKSNLTATGQLLNSLTVIKLKLKNAVGFRISVPDKTRGRDFRGRSSRGLTNRTLAGYVKEQGRNFFGFTKSQRNLIVKEIRNFILKGLK